jgi:hypothetical protein
MSQRQPWRRPRAAILYHYFYPDDVVSARHFAELCEELALRGWEVEAWPCHRACRDESASFPTHQSWRGVAIHRVWRPPWRQASALGRMLNATWMLAAWCGRAWRHRPAAPDVLLVGTDPVLSVLVAPIVRRFLPRTRVAHWCFDLYPEGPIAEGMLRSDGWVARLLHRLLRAAYGACDLVADLGDCMRRRLTVYGHSARQVTLVPWALSEPAELEHPDPATRRELFGNAPLGLLYSGNFGRAHTCASFLDLARSLRDRGPHFCFGVRGNRAEELRKAIRPEDTNVTLAGFAPEDALARRLAAADIHLVSLRPEWTGVVVPSKFFGSLAAGRPVLFAGGRDSAIARWVVEHQVGWVLDDHSHDDVVEDLRKLAAEPGCLAQLQRHCQMVYNEHFARCRVMDAWHRELLTLLPAHSRNGANGHNGFPASRDQNGAKVQSAANS